MSEPGSIAEHIARGEQLIESTMKIEDQDDFRVWRAERNSWIWSAAEAVGALWGEDAARALRLVTDAGTAVSDWRLALPKETVRVREALQHLRALTEE